MKSGRFFLWIGTAILLLVGLLGQMVLCGWAPPNMPAWVQPLLLAGELVLSAALLVQIVLYSHASRHWIRTIWDGMENIGLSAMQSVSFPIALLEENGVVFWYNRRKNLFGLAWNGQHTKCGFFRFYGIL